MFQQAGHSHLYRRTGILAVLYRSGWTWPGRPAELVRFRSGELAWMGDRGMSWGSERGLRIQSLMRGPTLSSWDAWRCDLETRRELCPPPDRELITLDNLPAEA